MRLQQWANWAEIIASFAVVVTLLILIQEVRGNTLALERQADLDRAAALTTPFFSAPQLASVLVKIKAVDGLDPFVRSLVERYDLTPADAVLWERHLWRVWLEHAADFERTGPSADLEAWIGGALATPDNRLYWEIRSPGFAPAFRGYVDYLAARIPEVTPS